MGKKIDYPADKVRKGALPRKLAQEGDLFAPVPMEEGLEGDNVLPCEPTQPQDHFAEIRRVVALAEQEGCQPDLRQTHPATQAWLEMLADCKVFRQNMAAYSPYFNQLERMVPGWVGTFYPSERLGCAATGKPVGKPRRLHGASLSLTRAGDH